MTTRTNDIIQWASDRKIIQNGTIQTQALKLASEFGELAGNLVAFKDIKDDIGDCFVVCCILTEMSAVDLAEIEYIQPSHHKFESGYFVSAANHLGDICDYAAKDKPLEMVDAIKLFLADLHSIVAMKQLDFAACVDVAYEDIKDRKGYLNEQGCFIKEESDELAEAN